MRQDYGIYDLKLCNLAKQFFKAEVVIIGFSPVGTTVLYHLTKLGYVDAMLFKKSGLASGSKTYAAGIISANNGKIVGWVSSGGHTQCIANPNYNGDVAKTRRQPHQWSFAKIPLKNLGGAPAGTAFVR